MYKYKLTLSYDGTAYSGWQVQPNGVSIQKTIQDKLEIFLKVRPDLTGSGRTDSGVHARAQTSHFEFDEKLDLFRFQHALNSLLPCDIRALKVELMPAKFHSRFDATGKIYTYHLSLGPYQNPFSRHYSWHVPYRTFSLPLMKEASHLLLGEHDFKGFASESHKGVAARDSIRSIRRLEIREVAPNEVVIEIEADGFLYKMVRNIVGTLVDIGRGQLQKEVIPLVFQTKERKNAGQTAPAHALFLDQVLY